MIVDIPSPGEKKVLKYVLHEIHMYNIRVESFCFLLMKNSML